MKKKFKTLSIVMVVALVAANVTFVVFDRRNVKSEILLSDVEGLSYNPDWLSDLFSNNDGPEDLKTDDCGSFPIKSINISSSADSKNSANLSADASYDATANVGANVSGEYKGNYESNGDVELESGSFSLPFQDHHYVICKHESGGHCKPRDETASCQKQLEDLIKSLKRR
jgi:hypothetical protein